MHSSLLLKANNAPLGADNELFLDKRHLGRGRRRLFRGTLDNAHFEKAANSNQFPLGIFLVISHESSFRTKESQSDCNVHSCKELVTSHCTGHLSGRTHSTC